MIISNRTDDAKLWLFWLVDTLPQEDLTWVLVAMWVIWWARRCVIHDEQFQSPMSTSCFITNFLEDLEFVPACNSETARDLHVTSKDLHVTERVVPNRAWLPPADHEAKLNVDGGLSRNGNRGAAAVVCRDKHDHYLGASTIVFEGLVDPATLEAQACNEALALATDHHLDSVCIVSDCVEVVANIDTEAPCHYPIILRGINHRRGSFQEIKFFHEKREHNGEAHALTKAAFSLSGAICGLQFCPTLSVFM